MRAFPARIAQCKRVTHPRGCVTLRSSASRLRCSKAFLDGPGLGLDVLEIGFPGLRLGPQLTQIGFQLSDALGPTDEPPPEAMSVFRVVPMMFVAPMIFFMPTLAATAALGLATSTLTAASFLPARALAATAAGAAGLLAVAAPTLVLAVVSTTALVSAITSALSAHRLQPPVVI